MEITLFYQIGLTLMITTGQAVLTRQWTGTLGPLDYSCKVLCPQLLEMPKSRHCSTTSVHFLTTSWLFLWWEIKGFITSIQALGERLTHESGLTQVSPFENHCPTSVVTVHRYGPSYPPNPLSGQFPLTQHNHLIKTK